MKVSAFQFSNPTLLEVQFSVNEDFCEKSAKMEIRTTVDVDKAESGNEACVTVKVCVGDTDRTKAPFFVSVKEQAQFKWKSDGDPLIENDESLQRLLRQNAPALLIGYIRPVIAFVTSNSPYQAYHLPFMNLTEE